MQSIKFIGEANARIFLWTYHSVPPHHQKGIHILSGNKVTSGRCTHVYVKYYTMQINLKLTHHVHCTIVI
jgi:hypothetical protein